MQSMILILGLHDYGIIVKIDKGVQNLIPNYYFKLNVLYSPHFVSLPNVALHFHCHEIHQKE